jgi:N-formylglutamate deformylase
MWFLATPFYTGGGNPPPALALPDTDWHVPLLYDFHRDLSASVIIARNSRYVVDLNRPPDGAPLYPGKTETQLCPVRTFADEPVYRPGQEPDADEIRERIHSQWNPYHLKLAEIIETIRNQHGHCVLWDAHSIKSEVPAFFDGRLPDLNVGTADGASCSRSLAECVMRQLRSQSRFSSVLNGRFKGGYITRHYGDPARGVDAIQLEIAQSAYMSEATPQDFDPGMASHLKNMLHPLLAEVLKA